MSDKEDIIINLLKSIDGHLLNITLHNEAMKKIQTTMYNWSKEEHDFTEQMRAKSSMQQGHFTVATPVYSDERPGPGVNKPTEAFTSNPFGNIGLGGLNIDPKHKEMIQKIGEMITSGQMHVPNKEEFEKYMKYASHAMEQYLKEEKNFDESVIKRKPRWDYKEDKPKEEIKVDNDDIPKTQEEKREEGK